MNKPQNEPIRMTNRINNRGLSMTTLVILALIIGLLFWLRTKVDNKGAGFSSLFGNKKGATTDYMGAAESARISAGIDAQYGH